MAKTELLVVRVPFYDTDAMGVVHHASYLHYLENARIEWLRSQGLSYAKMQADKLHLPVVKINIRYKKPCRFDDVIVVAATPRLEGIRMIFDYEIKKQSGEVVLNAQTEHVLVDENLKMREPPTEIVQKIKGD
ncbi:MAG: acyl-CoA thioesterase [Oligoflexia bacterium]|nr:acyl-CoA thioesterase [Oligoflexia bacterium]